MENIAMNLNKISVYSPQPSPTLACTCTVGSRLSESRLSISRHWTSAHVAVFSASAGKRRCGHWSFATGERKLLYERLSQALQCFFYAVRDLDRNFQRRCQLNEAVNAVLHVHCITAWQIKRRGKQDLSCLQSLTHDRLIIALSLFHRPCPRFRLTLGLQNQVSAYQTRTTLLFPWLSDIPGPSEKS